MKSWLAASVMVMEPRVLYEVYEPNLHGLYIWQSLSASVTDASKLASDETDALADALGDALADSSSSGRTVTSTVRSTVTVLGCWAVSSSPKVPAITPARKPTKSPTNKVPTASIAVLTLAYPPPGLRSMIAATM